MERGNKLAAYTRERREMQLQFYGVSQSINLCTLSSCGLVNYSAVLIYHLEQHQQRYYTCLNGGKICSFNNFPQQGASGS